MTATYTPPRVPSGYKLRQRFTGESAGGFHGAGNDQVAFQHMRGWQKQDVAFPLMVYVTSAPGQELIGNHGRKGVPISLGISNMTGIYHDGMWYIDGDALQEVGLERAKQWRTDLVHSLTIQTPDQTLGIRARRDVSVENLLEIARSVIPA